MSVQKAISKLGVRLRLMVTRGIVELVNDSLKCQGLQVSLLSDEVQDEVERFQDYGITSTPFTGAEALFLSVGADRSHGVVVCVTDRRYRPKDLVEGDVCLYTDKGERVYLNRVDDIVHLGAKAAAEFLALGQKVDDAIAAVQSAYDSHIHTTTATVGAGGTPGVISPPSAAAGAQPTTQATKVKAT